MKIKFEVATNDVDVRSGKNDRGPWEIREQLVYMHKGDAPYPEMIKVTLEKNQQPYAPGMYELREDSFFVGKYKDLMCRPRLRPLVAQANQQKVG